MKTLQQAGIFFKRKAAQVFRGGFQGNYFYILRIHFFAKFGNIRIVNVFIVSH